MNNAFCNYCQKFSSCPFFFSLKNPAQTKLLQIHQMVLIIFSLNLLLFHLSNLTLWHLLTFTFLHKTFYLYFLFSYNVRCFKTNIETLASGNSKNKELRYWNCLGNVRSCIFKVLVEFVHIRISEILMNSHY